MGGEALVEETHPIWHTPAVQEAATAGQFGALIRMTRTARKLTLVQVGEMVGYSASTLSRIETGQRKLTDVTQLRLFANALDIPPHLLGIIPSTAPPPPDGAASSRFALTPTTVSPTLGEGGDDAVQRRQLLAGLVGVTGVALLGTSNRPHSAQATPLAQHLEPLIARGAHPALQPFAAQVLRDRLATAHATFHACRYHGRPRSFRTVDQQL
ncbi:MAG: helix-turn-helix domain-containing protein [Actinobacteria bacterium]|nr:helix-turn-helix domain-containing protein [Actinomycetota bacterium]